MRIIVVEDDEYKAKQIEKFLTKEGNKIIIRKSYNTGMKAIVNDNYDLIILDMALPSYENSSLHPPSRNRKYGGIDILNEMHRKEIQTPAIIITQSIEFGHKEKLLEDLNIELLEKYPEIYNGIVFYNASILDWQFNLEKIIRKVIKMKK